MTGHVPRSATRVLFVDQTAQLAGGELNLYDYLRSAPESAVVVLLEDGPFRPLLEALSIPVVVCPLGEVGAVRRAGGIGSMLRALPSALRLRRQLREQAQRADVLYANSQKAFLLSVVSKRRGQPLIWHLHDMLVPEHFSTLLRKIAVFAGNRFATRVIVNSQATADAFVREGGRADKVRLVYCGLDPKPFDLIDAETAKKVRAGICSSEHTLVGVFGRLAEWKGQHVLLEAVSTLPNVHVAVVGGAFFGESAYQQRLVERAQRDDLAGRVHFLGFQREIASFMKAIDIIAHTSTAPEPFGRVIVEGMLARRTMIAANAGGAAEIVEHGRSGLLTLPGSVSELREAIQLLIEDPTRADQLAIAGRKRAEDFFLLPAMVDKVQSVIADVGK